MGDNDIKKERRLPCVHPGCKFGRKYHGHYIIPGDPIPLARARFGNRRVWDAQKQTKACTSIILANQHKGLPLFQGVLLIEMIFYFGIPKSLSDKKKKERLGELHPYKPDLSNLVKFMEDVGTGILYKDDCSISSIYAFKCYDNNPRTIYTISQQYE